MVAPRFLFETITILDPVSDTNPISHPKGWLYHPNVLLFGSFFQNRCPDSLISVDCELGAESRILVMKDAPMGYPSYYLRRGNSRRPRFD
jgi:hypothetical protein